MNQPPNRAPHPQPADRPPCQQEELVASPPIDLQDSGRRPCQSQQEEMLASSQTYPQVFYLMDRAKTHGLSGTMRRIFRMLLRRSPPDPLADRGPADAVPPAEIEEKLNLQPGELVEVRSREEILSTLDANGLNKGLLLMPEMLQFCGQRFKVFKRVERFVLEHTGEFRRMKNTVLLDGVLCDGWGGACNRSCFFFWREAWLKRVEPQA
jgi:hypothetical protein